MRSSRLMGVGLVAVALAVAACSSAASSGSSSGAPAASVGGAATTSGTGGTSSAAAAQAAVQKWSAVPTSIPETSALPSAPPKGKTVLYLQCEEVTCGYEGDGIEAAAAAIGWNVKVLNFQAANPATLVSALQTGLQYHPVAAFFSGVPQEAWQSEQKAYAAAGAIIVDNYAASAPTGPGTAPGRGYASQNVALGTVLADEQIASSDGQPANSLLVDVPTYVVFAPLVSAYKAQIAKDCPSCQVTEDNYTLPEMLGGDLVPAVVSEAKRISGLKYIISVAGSFTATLPQALQAAGLGGKFKIISGLGEATDQQNVLNGTQLATAGAPYKFGGWQDMDIAIRSAMHLSASPGDGVVPWMLLTKANTGTPSGSYDEPANYPALFEKLWHVG